jgi:hypothetical protein
MQQERREEKPNYPCVPRRNSWVQGAKSESLERKENEEDPVNSRGNFGKSEEKKENDQIALGPKLLCAPIKAQSPSPVTMCTRHIQMYSL